MATPVAPPVTVPPHAHHTRGHTNERTHVDLGRFFVHGHRSIGEAIVAEVLASSHGPCGGAGRELAITWPYRMASAHPRRDPAHAHKTRTADISTPQHPNAKTYIPARRRKSTDPVAPFRRA